MNSNSTIFRQSPLTRVYTRRIYLLKNDSIEIIVDTLSLWVAIPLQIILFIPIYNIVMYTYEDGFDGFYDYIFSNPSALYIGSFIILQGNFLFSILTDTILVKLKTIILLKNSNISSNLGLKIGENEFKREQLLIDKSYEDKNVFKISNDDWFGQPYKINQKIVLELKDMSDHKFSFSIPRIPFSFYSRFTIILKI